MITVAAILSACGCSGTLFKKDEKSYDELKKEVTELSMRLTRKMLAGDYNTLAPFIREEEATSQVKQIITNINPNLVDDVILTMESVSVLPGSYSTEIHYKTMFIFEKESYTFTFVMKLERREDSWIINNMVALASDMRTLNKAYLDGLANDGKDK